MIPPVNPNYVIKKLNGVSSFKQKAPSIDETIKQTVDKLFKRAEYEVPEYGRLFKPVEEEFQNPDLTSIANRIKFSIKPSTSPQNQTDRILKMDIFSLKGNSISPIFECAGKDKPFGKKQLLEYIQSEKFLNRIKEEILNADKALLKRQLGD